MDLSIIIINWNSSEYLRECLKSVYNETKNLDFEIIVVDNASSDGCECILEKEFPSTIFVQSKENIGFGKANNLGFQHSAGRNLLFLNPDTKIIGPAIYKMYNYMETIPDAGAAGCKLLNSDESIQTSSIQVFPTILNQILDVKCLQVRFPNLKFWGIDPLFSENSIPKEVEAVSGACLMIKRHVFEKIEKFTTDYFMYTEDIDLCYKIHNAGYKVYHIGEAQVVHYGGGSSRKHKNALGVVLMRESIFKFFQMRKGKLSAILYRFSLSITSIIRLSLIGILISLPVTHDDKFKFRFALNKWKNILRWSLGFERWASELSNKNK